MPPAKRNWSPHCFTMRTASLMYYVGENTRQTSSMKVFSSSVGSASSVFGGKEDLNPTQVAESWEEAIRQALMPVAPRGPGSVKKRSGPEGKLHGLCVVRQDAVVEDTLQKQVEEEEEV